MKRGRPPKFDREEALDRAMALFWEHGYEGTSIEGLTAAMGVSPSSLYAAFGDKEQLYQATVDRYLAGPGAFLGRALDEEPDTATAVARILSEAPRELTAAGCMVALGATHCGPAAASVRSALLARRSVSLDLLTQRLGAPAARFLYAVLAGMSVLARDGASVQELAQVSALAARGLGLPDEVSGPGLGGLE